MNDPGFAALLATRPDPDKVAGVLDQLRTIDVDGLNEMLHGVTGPALFRWVNGVARTELTDLLGRQRRDDLDAKGLARVVHGMQSQRRTQHRDDVLVEILLSRTGADLTRLKNFINTAEDHQDLEDLVFVDLSEDDRNRVLAHIAEAAGETIIKDPKVLSDIDDTVFCTLHDRRWPRGMLYPGVMTLFKALDEGQDDDPFDEGDLTFVTSRPADAWGLLENRSRSALVEAGVSRLSVLSGSLRALVSKEAMATRKMKNISHYRLLFPEYRLVFLGDSGQGDVLVGERLLAQDRDAVQLVLIHDVVNTPPDLRAEYAARGIHFHDTYVGAAVIAFEHDLISPAGLSFVANKAVHEFETATWDNKAQRDHMQRLFERDLERLEAAEARS